MSKLVENITAIEGPFEAGLECPVTHCYKFMRDNATEYRAGGAFRDRLANSIIEFPGARRFEDEDIAFGSPSTNGSSLDVPIPRRVEEQLDWLCAAADEESFEAGVESRLSESLEQLSIYDPIPVIRALTAMLRDNLANPEILSEILQWASRQEARAIRADVIDLLSMGLYHRSSLVRDSAALGLACLDEITAIPYVRQAVERERVPELRRDMESLLRSLET